MTGGVVTPRTDWSSECCCEQHRVLLGNGGLSDRGLDLGYRGVSASQG